jgi:sirohydrochlorin cobaltochelatase
VKALILFAHGARDPEWARPFHRIRALLNERLPGTPVELAFLEIMKPDLAAAMDQLIARGANAVTVVPLFMAQGGHLRQDLPRLIESVRTTHPGVTIAMTSPIGEVEAILQQMAEWIVAEYKT